MFEALENLYGMKILPREFVPEGEIFLIGSKDTIARVTGIKPKEEHYLNKYYRQLDKLLQNFMYWPEAVYSVDRDDLVCTKCGHRYELSFHKCIEFSTRAGLFARDFYGKDMQDSLAYSFAGIS